MSSFAALLAKYFTTSAAHRCWMHTSTPTPLDVPDIFPVEKLALAFPPREDREKTQSVWWAVEDNGPDLVPVFFSCYQPSDKMVEPSREWRRNCRLLPNVWSTSLDPTYREVEQWLRRTFVLERHHWNDFFDYVNVIFLKDLASRVGEPGTLPSFDVLRKMSPKAFWHMVSTAYWQAWA